MAVRDFTAARAEHQDLPLLFRLAGQEFQCRRRLAAGHVLDLAASGDDDIKVVTDFLRASLLSESWDRFHELMQDPDALGDGQPVEFETINAIVEWLVEEQTGRPTQPPTPSRRGRSSSGRSSSTSSRSRSA